MNTIILDGRKIKMFEHLQEVCEYVGKSQEFTDTLWDALLKDGELAKEYLYYMDHQTFLEEMKVEGYSLIDLYMRLMRKHNVMQDYGKNSDSCNKDALVLDTFFNMVKMKENPEKYVREMKNDFSQGMDQMDN